MNWPFRRETVRRGKAPPKRSSGSFRPLLESLEDRTLPSTVSDLLQTGVNNASDEDREYLIDRVRNVDSSGALLPEGSPLTVGQIDVGDSFRGLINFNTLNDTSANLGGLTGNNELSGVFQALVTSKVDLGGGTFQFTFAPDPTFAEGGVAGALIVLWEDATPNYAEDFNDPAPATPPGGIDDGTPGRTVPPSSADVSTGLVATEEAFIATAKDGTRFATLGFNGQTGEGFRAISQSGDNVLSFFNITSGSSGAFNDFSLSRLDGPGSETFDSVTLGPVQSIFPLNVGTAGFVGIVGSQQLRGVADLDTPFEVSSNTNISFNIEQPTGYEGGTPGFWKNHPEAWEPTGYSPGDSYEAIFGVDLTGPLDMLTLQEALELKGGGEKAMIRASAAALLNAAHPDVNYPLTVNQVIQLVQDAYNGDLTFNYVSNLLDEYNNLPHPL